MARMVLSDGEWRIMNLLWKDAPLRVPEITERLRAETGWSRATVNMMLARLEEKGAVESRPNGRGRIFIPSSPRRRPGERRLPVSWTGSTEAAWA